eukprot:1193385-Prorocentrum_minimum.AAC.4
MKLTTNATPCLRLRASNRERPITTVYARGMPVQATRLILANSLDIQWKAIWHRPQTMSRTLNYNDTAAGEPIYFRTFNSTIVRSSLRVVWP